MQMENFETIGDIMYLQFSVFSRKFNSSQIKCHLVSAKSAQSGFTSCQRCYNLSNLMDLQSEQTKKIGGDTCYYPVFPSKINFW